MCHLRVAVAEYIQNSIAIAQIINKYRTQKEKEEEEKMTPMIACYYLSFP